MKPALPLALVALAGCSMSLMRDPEYRPSATPVVLDTAFAVAFTAIAIGASQADCHDLGCGIGNAATGALFGIAAVPLALSAIYGWGRLGAAEPPPPALANSPRLAPPGMTLTCEQRREAQLALAREAAREEGRAVVLRDLPSCNH